MISLLPQRVRSLIGGRYWGRALAAGGQTTWMSEPVVRRYINEAVSGSADVWPVEWLQAKLQAVVGRCVSLGCGDGPLERDLLAKGVCRSVMGLDISDVALERARRLATEAGVEQRVQYGQIDLNTIELAPGAFEGAFFHQSLHHVEALEQCLRGVDRGLAPGSLLYLDEYVGPSRGEWRRELLADADRLYRSLPPLVRKRRRLQLPVDWRDPTEAVRSSEIVRAVRARFEVEEERPYGGNFLSVIYPHLSFESLDHVARAQLLQDIIDAEREHLAQGVGSYYTVMICRSRDQAANAG